MRSLSRVPGISLGTKAPLGRTTLPSVLRLHFPARINSSTLSHSLIKCGPPQKLQVVLRGAESEDEAAGLLYRPRLLLLMASTIVFVNSLKNDPKSSCLTDGSLFAIETTPSGTNEGFTPGGVGEK